MIRNFTVKTSANPAVQPGLSAKNANSQRVFVVCVAGNRCAVGLLRGGESKDEDREG
jgi:hypothetical protein